MTSAGDALEITRVRFRTNWTVTILILAALSGALLTFAALDQSVLLQLSEQRRAGWLVYLTVFEYGGVNWAVAAILLGLFWESRKPFRQWRDPIAVKRVGEELVFHPSVRSSAVSLNELSDIACETGVIKSDLVVNLKTSQTLRIRNVDDSDARELVETLKQQCQHL